MTRSSVFEDRKREFEVRNMFLLKGVCLSSSVFVLSG
jgi:hypothetical protein